MRTPALKRVWLRSELVQDCMAETISVVVPVYNNQPTLEETARQIIEVHARGFSEFELEIIFVNDGSTDKSWEELLRLQHLHHDRISLINLSRNFGQSGALFAGFEHARGDAIICISADLQDPIDLMEKMVACWKNNAEIVICYREGRNDGFFSSTFSSIAHSIARVSYAELPTGGFDYWLMSRRVCETLRAFKERNVFLQGYLSSVGFSKVFIPYVRMKRAVGQSGYSFWKKLGFVIILLVKSSVPIQFMMCLGAFISLCGAIYSLLIVYAWLMNRTPFSGWAPLDDSGHDDWGGSHDHAGHHRGIHLADIR